MGGEVKEEEEEAGHTKEGLRASLEAGEGK